MRRYRYRTPIDYWTNYREIRAKRSSSCAGCQGEIQPGELIGYNPRNKKTRCAACWSAWCAEVRAEEEGATCW